MNFKSTFILSFLVSLCFSATYSMDSNLIKSQLIGAIKSLNVNKVKILALQGKSSFTTQDKQDFWNEINNHPIRKSYRSANIYGENFGLAIRVAAFFAVFGIIAYLVKDARIPEVITPCNFEGMSAGQKFGHGFDVVTSYIDHYAAQLFNVVKNGAKYACSGISVSTFTYAAIQVGLMAYQNYYNKNYDNIFSFMSSELPSDN